MLKNISSERPMSNIHEWSECIKERNAYIKNGKYSVVDGGMYVYGDCIVVGDNHVDAGKYLEDCLSSCMSTTEAINFQKETEDIYNVQVWTTTDFDLNAVKAL